MISSNAAANASNTIATLAREYQMWDTLSPGARISGSAPLAILSGKAKAVAMPVAKTMRLARCSLAKVVTAP